MSESQSAQPALLPDRRCAITVGADWSAGFKPTFAIALGEGLKRDVTGGVNLASRVFWGSFIGQTELVLRMFVI